MQKAQNDDLRFFWLKVKSLSVAFELRKCKLFNLKLAYLTRKALAKVLFGL